MGDLNFQRYHAKVTSKIGQEMNQFCALTKNTSRIKFAFDLCDEFQYLGSSCPKNYEWAEALKVRANKLFQQRDNAQAISIYNEAITTCPQDDLEGKKLYAILIANRSAVFFEDGEYQKVLQDTAFLKQYGHHPNPDKIAARESKALQKAFPQCRVLELNEDGTVKTPPREESNWNSGNITYPALSKKLTIKKNKIMGRHVVATDDFKPGEIVAIEQPYVSAAFAKQNCDYCLLSTNQIQVCPKCTTVYCSMQCLQKGREYHQYECFYADLFIPNNIRLAWRMITQRTLQQVTEEETYANQVRIVNIYKTDDYYNVHRLVQNEDKNNLVELINTTFYALFILNLLRTTDYFGPKAINHNLSEEEVLVGDVIMRYVRILHYNSLEIFEIRNDKMMADSKETWMIGAGLYTTLSLFNHSCDPSVVIYYIKNTAVMRSIKPIKAGDVVYDNYGLLYMYTTKQERINKMETIYRFTCKCQACVEDWPLLKDIKRDVLPGLCACGGTVNYPLESFKSLTPSSCEKCKRLHCPVPMLTGLMHNGVMLRTAESLFGGGHFQDAWKLFAKSIDTHFKYLATPNIEIVLNQDRLLGCLYRIGNRSYDYQFVYYGGKEDSRDIYW